jgi:hypothetical protein
VVSTQSTTRYRKRFFFFFFFFLRMKLSTLYFCFYNFHCFVNLQRFFIIERTEAGEARWERREREGKGKGASHTLARNYTFLFVRLELVVNFVVPPD